MNLISSNTTTYMYMYLHPIIQPSAGQGFIQEVLFDYVINHFLQDIEEDMVPDAARQRVRNGLM